MKEPTPHPLTRIIVIGASAGGLSAVSEAIKGLDADMGICVLVALHISSSSDSQQIARVLQKQTGLVCQVAVDGAPVREGQLYVAPPDHQFMVSCAGILLNKAAHENKYRPAVDVLFRSAAVHFGNKVIAIILTGLFDDGTSGMYAVKQCGGTLIVQDPDQAQFSDMPQSVINKLQVDHCVNLEKMPDLLKRLISAPLPPPRKVPEEIELEARITEDMMTKAGSLRRIGEPSDFACPDCGGNLYTIEEDDQTRYRCHTGHVYSEQLLSRLKDSGIAESLWVSLRMMEEKENLLLLMSGRAGASGRKAATGERIKELRRHIQNLKRLLMSLGRERH